jgi:hypothetical protein
MMLLLLLLLLLLVLWMFPTAGSIDRDISSCC